MSHFDAIHQLQTHCVRLPGDGGPIPILTLRTCEYISTLLPKRAILANDENKKIPNNTETRTHTVRATTAKIDNRLQISHSYGTYRVRKKTETL